MRWDIKTTSGFSLNNRTIKTLVFLLSSIVLYRLIYALVALQQGSVDTLGIFSFSVIFPAAFILFLLLFAPKARSVEGVYMLFGSVILFLLIILIKSLALHLLLGWPVVFLLVELYATKAPNTIQKMTQSMLVTGDLYDPT
jgi:hypothetical protein